MMYGTPPPGHQLEQIPDRPAGATDGWAPAGWPAKPHIDYVKTMVELLLLLLAVPWLVKRVVRNPKSASKAAAKHHLD